MPSIRSLRANVTREEAMEQFASHGIGTALKNTVYGPLQSVADFYIPFLLFQVEIQNRGKTESRIYGLDAINGSLDPYQFEDLPGTFDIVYLETRNCAKPMLDEAGAKALLISKVRRLLFSTGFFRMSNLQITAEVVPGEIHIPYWVGFRGRGPRAQFTVMDAMRRTIEGAKVRHLLRDWLTSIAVNS
ncbi:MAG TPA: hypothetical protein VFA68_07015 [Terriglobales bacterium]|nr:hypothetical protein [Terriglobales bacterium]